MDLADSFSYRHAAAILEIEYPAEKREIFEVVGSVSWQPKSSRKDRSRGGRVVARLDVDQVATNNEFQRAFEQRGWQTHPRIVSDSTSRLVADFKKGAVQVEIQFGNMARWYTDIFKFLLSYSAGSIEVGVLVVPMMGTARRIDENVANYERVVRELPHAKMAVTIPVWVLGVS